MIKISISASSAITGMRVMGNIMALPSLEPLPLWDFQEPAVESIFEHFAEYDSSPIVVAPTGSGKSTILAEFIRRSIARFPGTRFIVLAHVAELLKQDAAAIIRQCPGIKVTFYSDTIGKKDLSGQVIVAGIQSIYKKAFKIPTPAPSLVIIDEAHLLSPKDGTMYRKFLSELSLVNPDIKCVGLSATPFRTGTGYLHKGENAFFGRICYEIGILELIERGFLTPIVTPKIKTKMDANGVKIQGGDYVRRQLEKKIDLDEITIPCVDEIMQHGADRKKWIVFTAGVQHCEHVRDEIRKRGISCEMVTANTPTEERNAIVTRHKTGDLRCLVNVSVFTTGFDSPSTDLIALMRPTRSPVLYIQMMGRVMRTAPGKKDAVCLDFGQVIETLGPIDKIHLPTKKKGKGEAPHKICPVCKEECHAAARICVCGHEFPPPEIKIDHKASDAAVLSTQLRTDTKKVTNVSYYRHEKVDSKPTLRVEYLCGLMESYREWICLEHTGYAREKACKWWVERTGTRAPITIEEAINRKSELKAPEEIQVRRNGKYFDIVGIKI